jgi:nucleotide-binding universal stress UspA family protein
MSWGPIVVGVDGSPEATGAAALAQRLARDTGATCHLVHAVRDEWAPLAAVGDAERVREMQRLQLAVARDRVAETLRARVRSALVDALDVRFGPAALVLQQVAEERRAGLLVLGGKQHGALARWLGGSTSLNVVRSATVPVLVTAGSPAGLRRVLAAADLSSAAQPTLALAQRFARRVGAQLRILSVFEPLPVMAGVPRVDPTGYYELSQELLRREIWPLVPDPGAEKIVRHGMVVETLLREVTDWRADVLVVGSHGKGWAQRILLGSVTESLLNHLPTSVLVAPVGLPVAPEERRLVEVAAVES